MGVVELGRWRVGRLVEGVGGWRWGLSLGRGFVLCVVWLGLTRPQPQDRIFIFLPDSLNSNQKMIKGNFCC